MEVLSNAERQRRWRQRAKEGTATRQTPCPICGREFAPGQIDPSSTRGSSAFGRTVCSFCWRRSAEGKRWLAAQARERARRKREQQQQA